MVQSSGMGKSRMIDELSKEHFVIPINLRTKETGMVFLQAFRSGIQCPVAFRVSPGDYAVSSFLVHDPFTPDDASHRAQTLLISPFETTAKIIPFLDYTLKDITSNNELADRPTSTAQKFRLFMTHGQSYSHHGPLRRKFCDDVIRCATQVSTFNFSFYEIMMHHDL